VWTLTFLPLPLLRQRRSPARSDREPSAHGKTSCLCKADATVRSGGRFSWSVHPSTDQAVPAGFRRRRVLSRSSFCSARLRARTGAKFAFDELRPKLVVRIQAFAAGSRVRGSTEFLADRSRKTSSLSRPGLPSMKAEIAPRRRRSLSLRRAAARLRAPTGVRSHRRRGMTCDSRFEIAVVPLQFPTKPVPPSREEGPEPGPRRCGFADRRIMLSGYPRPSSFKFRRPADAGFQGSRIVP